MPEPIPDPPLADKYLLEGKLADGEAALVSALRDHPTTTRLDSAWERSSSCGASNA